MNFKKIVSAVAAAAIAVSAMAVSAFAVDLDSTYPGDWGASTGIQKAEFDKFEGDVKVVLTVETVNVKEGNSYLIKPMNKDKSWDSLVPSLTAEKATAKPDGWMQVRYDQTEVEFVVPKSVQNDLWGAGLCFQVNNVIVKSATLSDGAPENPFTTVTDGDTPAYCAGTFTPEYVTAAPAEEETAEAAEETAEAAEETAEAVEDTAEAVEDTAETVEDTAEAPAAEEAAEEDDAPVAVPAEEEAPAVDTTATAPAATGNVAAAAIVSVMAVAAVAAVAAKKRK